MVDEARGFLGRWARRKTDALQGNPMDEPPAAAKPATPDQTAVKNSSPGSAEAVPAAVLPSADATAAELPGQKTLSLDDVKLLTQDSDFAPFMARDVGPEVRNAAMKKLFADPHFNVMDGLDIYIDDYSKADPIPESMLRQMVGAQFLNLFDAEEKDERQNNLSALPRENANNPHDQTVAQSLENPDLAHPDPVNPEISSEPAPLPDAAASPQDHAHTHLRLQPDHAAPAPEAGRGTP